jgi:alkaline phosphatase D
VRLQIDTESTFKNPRLIPESGFESPDPDGVVAFRLGHLRSSTLYYYSVEVAGERSAVGKFRTFSEGPMSFRTAFASCASTGSNHRIFSTIQNLEPLFFLHMGDLHYENIRKNAPKRFLEVFDEVLETPRQADLYRSTPIAYVWDDHDFGPNNSDKTTQSRPAALKVYHQVVPHYPLVGENSSVESIQQAFSVGRVRFILTDTRAKRDPPRDPEGPRKTMLGQLQLQWLKDQLRNAKSTHALIAWVNVVPWITKKNESTEEGWARYSHERTELADYIRELGLVNKLVILSGDGHMVAIDDGTNSNYASDRRPAEHAFPVIHAAPLDRQPSIKGGPYSHGAAARRGVARILKEQRFGLMEVADDGNVLEVTFTGRRSDGEILKGMELTLRCEAGECKVVK